MRTFHVNNDQFKVSFLDVGYIFIYRVLSELFCMTGNPSEGLYVVELGRARALADLMSAHYSVPQISMTDPQYRAGIGRIIQIAFTCLCVSYAEEMLLLWILKAEKPILFRKITPMTVLIPKDQPLNETWMKSLGTRPSEGFTIYLESTAKIDPCFLQTLVT